MQSFFSVVVHLFQSCRASCMLDSVAYLAALLAMPPPYLDPTRVTDKRAAFRGHPQSSHVCEGHLSLPPSSHAHGPCGLSTPFPPPPRPSGFYLSSLNPFTSSSSAPLFIFIVSFCVKLFTHKHLLVFCFFFQPHQHAVTHSGAASPLTRACAPHHHPMHFPPKHDV